MAAKALTIGWLAASADVHVETVRYYQRRGLLREPGRPPGGVRRYAQADVSRLQFIRRAQTMGFNLDEIAELLKLKGQRACQRTRQLTELKLADVRRRLDELRRLESDLVQHVAECSQVSDGAGCPTLDLLVHSGAQSFSPKGQPTFVGSRQRGELITSGRDQHRSPAAGSPSKPEQSVTVAEA